MKKYSKLAILAGILPFIYGCGSGGGTAALMSMLFGAGSTGVSLLSATTGTALSSVGSEQLATLHQPEPASMLLLGGGLAAMAYFKKKSNRSNS